MSKWPGLLESLDIAIEMMRRNGHWRIRRAADRLQRERDMRHAINQGWGQRYRAKKAAEVPKDTKPEYMEGR